MIILRSFQRPLPSIRLFRSIGRSIALAACAALPLNSLAQWQLEDKPSKPIPSKPIPSKPIPSKPIPSTPKQETTPKSKPFQNNQSVVEPAAKPSQMHAVDQDHLRFVQVPRATVRCGPGSDYYPTTTLTKGSSVEVYVQTDDGWSGIRPPEGSHNWVQADALYLMPGGRMAEVAQDSVPAWVGSDTAKNEKLLFQTELSKTQPVAILGEAYRGQGDERKLWFRIAPPQGEFRWIKSSMIGVTPVAKDPVAKDPAAEDPADLERSGEKPNSLVSQATYQEPTESKLAWSDEAEQTQRARQEIQREQQKIDQELKASRIETKSNSSILSKSPTQSLTQSSSKTQPRTKPKAQTRTQPNSSAPSYRPTNNQPRQRISQRQVGPEQTDSMNHVLGIFGLSLVDPNNIQGHPLQGRTRAPAPQPYANAAPYGSATANPNPGAIAGIEHLPRPSGRYAPNRVPQMSYNPEDSLAIDSAGSYPEDRLKVSAASFAPSASYNPEATQNEIESFQTPQIQDALVQLSVIVSRPAEQWNLAPLRDSAQMWIERGETPLVRGEARLLLDRIERFESVRQRSSASPIAPPTNFSDALPLRSPASESEMSGWLVAVHTSLPGQPEFALTDDLGNVKAYVRPTTGLNLRRYVQQPVTVFGPQGFLPNLNAKQVVADRVVRLR